MFINIFFKGHHLTGYPSSSCWGSKACPSLISLGSEIGQIGIYDVRNIGNQKPYSLSRPHTRLVRRVEFSPELNNLATASEDCKTCVLKLTEPSVLDDASLIPVYVSIIYENLTVLLKI